MSGGGRVPGATPRIGVVGAGALGYHHIRLLRDLGGIQFAGFYESALTARPDVAAELSVRAFASLDELLDAIDALTVVVPTPSHYDVARAALERGLHLLIEKPLAASVEEADALLALAAPA